MEFTIKTNELKALLLITPKKDVRYYLNNIHFESTPEGVLAVSTDGHRLLAIKISNEPVEGLKHLVSRELCEQAIKTKANYINFELDNKQVTLSALNLSFTGLISDGVFPDFRRVIPATVSGIKESEFNNSYLVDFDKIGALLGTGKADILQNGVSSAMVKFGAYDAVGVLMPLRHDLPTSLTRPAWL